MDKKYHWRQLSGLLAGLILFLIVLILPAPAGMSLPAKYMAAVTLLMVCWWISEAIPIPATAMLPLVFFPVLGIMSSKSVSMNYSNHIVYLFLGGFIIALAMQKWNLHRRLALHIIALIGGSPTRIILGFMGATAFLSMWISNTACTMMMLPIATAVVLQLAEGVLLDDQGGAEAVQAMQDNFGQVLLLAIAYAASIGGIGTLIGTPPNVVFANYVEKQFPQAPEISFLDWMKVGLPLVLIFIPLVWLYLCRFGSRIHLKRFSFTRTGQEILQEEIQKLGPMSQGELATLCVFILTALLWIFRKNITIAGLVIPGWSNIFPHSNYIHDSTVAVAMGILLFIIPVKLRPWRSALNLEDLFVMDWKYAEQGAPWGSLLLFGGGFALAAGFKETGLDKWIGHSVSSLAGISPLLLIVSLCFLMTFLTEVTSNTATTNMMMPILAGIAMGIHVHPFLLLLPATLSASCAFMLPVATPPNAIIFASGWVTIPRMARVGLGLNIMGIVIITAIMYFIAFQVFGITTLGVPDWAH